MMNFSTIVPLKEERNQINYDSNIFLIGSCFSEHIGDKFQYYKFNTEQNPFGIIFHPKAIEKLLLKAINNDAYTEKDIFQLNEKWYSFDAHSKISSLSGKELIKKLNNAVLLAKKQINTASHIIITLGTAWVYRYIETDAIVANCHKVPQKNFLKELLSVEELIESLEAIIVLIESVNPKVKILFTVSPVRHLKDGFIENQRSKSHLITAVHEVVLKNDTLSSYFPSYEIMTDELRDYRFYKEDMIHPSALAVNYIWERFQYSWIEKESNTLMLEVDTIQKGMAHIPFNPTSKKHLAFLKKLEDMKSDIEKKYSHIKF